MAKIENVRGTKDLIGQEAILYEKIANIAADIFKTYGYLPIQTPIIEFSELFQRTLGDFSDVVNKEMYSFTDRGGENITLRPEFTASIIRAFISNGLHHKLPLRVYSHGPVFRYERPQKGRQRQFNQINVEALGVKSAKFDAEIIAMAFNFLEKLGLANNIKLHLNSLGCNESRKKFIIELTKYYKSHEHNLSPDSKKRLIKNPLRILDSKEENDKLINKNAPKLCDYYLDESTAFFTEVKNCLDDLGIKYFIDDNLVRGLDYYCHTIFEFVTNDLGAQGTVLGGGRYDGLSEVLSGPETPSIGFAAGLERLMLLMHNQNFLLRPNVVIPIGNSSLIEQKINKICHELRKNNIIIINEYDLSFNKRIKHANKINAKYGFFLGEDELVNNIIKVKDFDSGKEKTIKFDNLINEFESIKNEFSR